MGARSIPAFTGRRLRFAAPLAAALALGVIALTGTALAQDRFDAQNKTFAPEKVYPAVRLKGSAFHQDNDWNSQAPSGGSARPSAPASTAVPTRCAPTLRPLTTAPLRFLGTAEETGSRGDSTRPPSSGGPATRTGPVQILTPALTFLGTGPGTGSAPTSTVQRKSIQSEKLNFIGPRKYPLG